MMRYLFLASIVLLLSPVSPAFAETPDGTSFVDFAMRAGDGLDARWSEIAGGRGNALQGLSTVGRRSGGAVMQRSTTGRRTHARHTVDASGFIHKGKTERYFPITARTRDGATRGTRVLRYPASDSHGLSFDRRRQPDARMTKRGFFTRRASAPRKSPAMGQRIGGASSTRRTASRPAYRAARPRGARR